ncbi:UNVERIFIED_CONTAM: hypothetical protein GTU68_016407, partial [Idotea baltica]|nr:hypothetical protein [Idotea baltica]
VVRKVLCKKYNEELEGVDSPPFEDELGKEIYENVSKRAWLEWRDDMMIKIINEYRLNLAENAHYQTLIEQMKSFLGLSSEEKVLEVENADRGKPTA